MPVVLVIGCGIAGPVVAMLMKKKGYSPIVFEKVEKLGDAGLSLMLMPNGLKVLSLLGLDKVVLEGTQEVHSFVHLTSSGERIGEGYFPADAHSKYGQPIAGVSRTKLNLSLKTALLDMGVQVFEGHALSEVEESAEGVTARFANGKSYRGDFLIGCDGIKAASRRLLLEKKGVQDGDATYTGLIQTGGLSTTPDDFKYDVSLLNFYGAGAHFITYPISATQHSWALTKAEDVQYRETWRSASDAEAASQKQKLLEELVVWDPTILELIRQTGRLSKYGLYDRPGLPPQRWCSARCVLVGDAAHPTSPHLGQGANQALEDAYHISKILPDASSQTQGNVDYEVFFNEYAELRQPRTARFVQGARAQGELRVVTGGVTECLARDKKIREAWSRESEIEAAYEEIWKEPF